VADSGTSFIVADDHRGLCFNDLCLSVADSGASRNWFEVWQKGREKKSLSCFLL
jgi:hypothetical protein